MQRTFMNPVGLEQRTDTEKVDVVSKHMMEQLSIQRKNLLLVCKMCVKSLVDKSPFEAIFDDCPHLCNLCVVLEHIFIHRMQTRWSLFSTTKDLLSFWHVIQTCASLNSVQSIDDMESVHTDIGKCRVWIRLTLVQKKLSSFMSSLLSKQENLLSMYLPGAFLLSSELVELAGTLQCLDAIDFNLCLKDSDFDTAELKDIDYTPYLKFRQSEISQVDDLNEEYKLSFRQNNHHRTRQNNVESKQTGKPSIEEESISQLVEMLKTEKEQKNYYEELVSVRDSQIAKLHKDLDSLTKENEQHKKEMDRIVVELQQQISQLQSSIQAKIPSYSSSNNRRSGMFSGIFGGNSDT